MITTKDNITPENLEKEMHLLAERLKLENVEDSLYFPKYFQIETIRVCNARCTFCAVDQWDKSVPLMPDELFNKIADELGNYSDWIEFVCIQRAGEPLLDKKLVERVRKLKQVGIKRVNFSTNASLLTEKKARDLFEAGLDEVYISIDTVDKETYEQQRVGLKYETVINNIKSLFQVRNEVKPDAVLRVRGIYFSNSLDDPDEREAMIRWENFWTPIKKPHDQIYMKKAHNFGNHKDLNVDAPDYEWDWVYHPCIIPWSSMNITAMGKVALCCVDLDADVNMGDINLHSIAEVWRSEKYQAIRELHKAGKRNEIKLCQGCTIFDEDSKVNSSQEKQLIYQS
ncbi:MAG: radical SAM protein [Oscillatoriales cyanobacterium]|nr:MAG: radical SAM protein [Oscillatoriales cyanobacterium]